MKKFLISFLGAMSAIWLSMFLGIFLMVIFFAVAVASASKSSDAVKVRANSYLELDLSGAFADRTSELDYMALLQGQLNKEQVVGRTAEAIRRAASDDNIEGIYIKCGGSAAGIAQRQTLVEALRRFKQEAPSKWIYAYADDYTQGDYYVAASVADSLFLNPVGGASINGLVATTPFFKGFLDKVGVEMQVVKVGTYKSAVEPFILTNMSEASREQQQLFLGNIWGTIAASIAEGRKVSADTVNSWADSYLFGASAEALVERKVVDALCYGHEMNERLASLTGRKSASKLRAVGTSDYLRSLPEEKTSKGAVKLGVYYACGDITDSEGNGIVGTTVVADILELAEDNDIDGLMLFVNSGGGSAFASEQIWESLQYWKKTTGKPLYVYMSDYAASGGYYISSGADKIYAQPTTLTGSIGIFGLIPNAKGLITDKLGITFGTVKTNNASEVSIAQPLSAADRAALQATVDRGYDLFTRRCAEGRHMSQDSIKRIAEGRVWDGSEALKIGLVDELGNLDDALRGLAASLNAESWSVVEYPREADKWKKLLRELSDELETRYMRSRLGDMAPLYEEAARLRSLSGVQALAPVTDVTL